MSTVYNDPIMLDSTGQDIVTKLDSIASLMGNGVIDDTSTATDTTWSSNKITSELAGKQDELTFDHTPKDDSLNPVYSDGIYDSIIGVYDNLELGLGWDSKNILGIANTSKEVNGITFTVNDDGTIKLNGTATSATLYALNKFTGAELKKYGENLLMTGGKDNSTFLTLMTQDWSYTKDDKGDGVEINISELIDATEYTVIIQIANETTLSNYVMSPMIRLVNVIDPSFKKHHDSVDVIKADKVNVIANTKLIKDTVGWSGKNRFKIRDDFTGETKNGVAFTIDSKRIITANNQATAVATIDLGKVTLPAGKYIASGCPSGGDSNSYRVNVSKWVNNQEQGIGFDYGDGLEFTLAEETVVYMYPRIASGYTVSNLKFKLMIRDASILDSTYEPYFGSTAFPRSEQAVLGAKNFWRGYISPDPAAGVTYTQNADKSISTSGSATGEESFGRLMTNADLIAFINANKGKTFVLNGCPSGGSHTTYYISIWANNGLVVEDNGSGATFTIPSSDCTSANIAIHIKDGVDVSGKTWKPMISFDGGEYAPPAMTNQQLTEKMQGIIDAATNAADFAAFKTAIGNL